MTENLEIKKKLVHRWFVHLQNEICKQLISLEKNKKFTLNSWKKSNKNNEGGGKSFIFTNGKIFDKIGVNQSTVSGKFKKEFRSKIPGADKDGRYWASGISIVAHMKNPKMPALHFNTRFISTSQSWFGGGIDATPSYKDHKEKLMIHKKLKLICNQNKKNYTKYKNLCEKYFYLPHYNEQRGIGGIFFDYEKNNWKNNFKFVRDLGIGFLDITKSIINKKKLLKWNNRDKKKQFIKRGRYVEFNLLYDRGTKFGLNSGGNTEAILMSLPPKPQWRIKNE